MSKSAPAYSTIGCCVQIFANIVFSLLTNAPQHCLAGGNAQPDGVEASCSLSPPFLPCSDATQKTWWESQSNK
jgi:hypothetical protein